jgi:anaphase-promoting complex subunit 1
MAMGFLFIGNGVYTFSRSSKAIAGLICAVYPIFPATPADNKFHLQALRHFYVLAVETRLLQTREIDTGKLVNIPVQVDAEDESGIRSITITTPDIVNGRILKISLKGNTEYHDVDLVTN